MFDRNDSLATLLAKGSAAVAAVEASTEDPALAERIRRGAFHLAGLLDALGLFPTGAAALVAEAVADYATEPPETPAEG